MPGAGIDAASRVVTFKRANFLVPQPALRNVFRARKDHELPAIDPAVWHKDWGVHLQPFGSGENIIKYLGRYVSSDSTDEVTAYHVHVSWKPCHSPRHRA